MWNWIKKLFSRETQKPLVLTKQVKINLSKTTKGDKKKLYASGKITADQVEKGK